MGKHKWMLIILISLVLAQTIYFYSATLLASANSGTDDWTMFRHDILHSGCTAGNGEANSVKLLWAFKTWGSVRSSPSIADGYVFVGSKDWRVYCLNSSNGAQVWNYTTGGEVNSSPAIYKGSVIVGSDDGYVYSFEILTGTVVWKSAVGGEVWSSPVIVDGRIYIGGGKQDVYCLDASDGAVIYRFPTSSRVRSSPAISDGIIYFATGDYFLYAVNSSTGSEIWRTHTGAAMSSPSLSNGCVFVGSVDGYVFGLNASTGAKIWAYQTENSVDSSAAVAYGIVYVGSMDNQVYALNATNGQKIWQSSTGYWVWSSPAVANGNVYVGSEDFNVYCFDAFTGAKKWSFQTGGVVDSSPSVVNNNLYVGSNDNYLYALALDSSVVETLPSELAMPWMTIAFDAIASAVAALVVISIALFVHSSWQNKPKNQSLKMFGKKASWILKHADALCVLAILSFSLVFFVNLGSGPLWATDEQTYSQWAYHMFKTGDYLTPWAYGEVKMWVAKPPLIIWLMSLAYQIFGVNNFATRFWSPIFGALSLVLVFYLGKKLYNRSVGLLSALVLGTFTTFYAFARHAMLDVPFIFFTLGSVYFLLLHEKAENSSRYVVLSGFFFGLALMTKQIQALLIPIILFAYFAVSRKSIRFFFTKRFRLFWAVAVLVFVPWVIYMILRFGPDFWDSYFIFSDVMRTFTPIEGHTGGYLYYFSFLVNNENLLWIILLPFATVFSVFNSVVKHSKQDILLLAWITIVFLVFTLAQTKLSWYILPAYPAFAIAISSLIYQLLKKTQLAVHDIQPYINRIINRIFPR